MRISYAKSSYQGDRPYNEDFVGEFVKTDEFYCFAVADGLGGHGKGEIASETVVKSVISSVEKSIKNLDDLFEIAQGDLLQKQEELFAEKEMKTTLNVLLTDGNSIESGHIGDTRTYYFGGLFTRMISRTIDHSVPQVLADCHEIKEADIRKHPDRNRLLKVLGERDSELSVTKEKKIRVNKKQYFLMCTDGFWEYILEEDMLATLKQSVTPEEWLNKMNKIVKENGSGDNMDNYSAMAIWIEK